MEGARERSTRAVELKALLELLMSLLSLLLLALFLEMPALLQALLLVALLTAPDVWLWSLAKCRVLRGELACARSIRWLSLPSS